MPDRFLKFAVNPRNEWVIENPGTSSWRIGPVIVEGAPKPEFVHGAQIRPCNGVPK